MQDFLRSQHDILNSSKITWDKSVIKTCLSLWSRSVKCYEQLRDSNIFKLPSGRQLRRYKSSVEQKPGVSNDVLRWMRNTAIQVNVPPSGYHGGLLHDEAKIQEDLVLNVKGERSELVGSIDTGSEAENLRIVKENKVSRKLATDVLQITFLGYTGFRFPIAHYPTDGVKASELYIIIWDLISQLQSWGFIVDFIMQDGGQQNREFTKLHFTGEPRKNHFMCDSLVNPDRKVYHYSAEKMRNHLAEEVLNEDMLQLMKSYQNSLINGDVLNSAIDLLQQTSKLITVFRDPRPVTDIHDARLNILNNALDWFNNWRNEIKQIKKTPKELEWMLPSIKCLDDVESMIVVFTRVCRIHITEFKGRGVYPSRFNSDLAENIFCQQRGLYKGNSTNPNYHVYCNTMNSVILGQTTKSRARKSNAGLPTTDPYSFHVNVPLSKKRKHYAEFRLIHVQS
ncbi:unnamed protein product [Mytilus edulis]|uniref:Transposable element P transposase-like RNase H domain-containing protein n=1 Tax=Mytilus edulis TaxID=6550 RepID=A0A8S3SR25_MYTED|nr:unnamed protein product [Mytilus edulis]